VVVFDGHGHTNEMYEVDGVKYLMLGGGGAEQDPILPGRTSIKLPADYPQELYWRGEPPKEDYNYVLVDVDPGGKTRFTLNRFRPWSAEPFATVALFKGGMIKSPGGTSVHRSADHSRAGRGRVAGRDHASDTGRMGAGAC